jgi:4-hydroxybenzoate polyprenyltransferase
VEQKLGRRYQRVEEMEDDREAPRETFFSGVSRLEAEFWLALALAVLAAAAVGLGSTAITLPMLVAAVSGAAAGAVLGRLIYRHDAERLQEQLERGGLLLWIGVRSKEQERNAMKILEAHAARHVHAHDLAP